MSDQENEDSKDHGAQKLKLEKEINPVEMKKKKEVDKSYGIDITQFQNIHFKQGWPNIITDLAQYLTGSPDCLQTKIIQEEQDDRKDSTKLYCSEEELNATRSKLTQQQFYYAINTFRTFSGAETKALTNEDIEKLSQTALYSDISGPDNQLLSLCL